MCIYICICIYIHTCIYTYTSEHLSTYMYDLLKDDMAINDSVHHI